MNDLIIDDVFESKSKPFKFSILAITIWVVIILLSLYMKLMDWPGGTILSCISTAGFSGYSFLGLIVSKASYKLSIWFSFIAIAWFVYIIYGYIWGDGYPYNIRGIIFYGVIVAAVYWIYDSIHKRSIRR